MSASASNFLIFMVLFRKESIEEGAKRRDESDEHTVKRQHIPTWSQVSSVGFLPCSPALSSILENYEGLCSRLGCKWAASELLEVKVWLL